MGQKQKFSNILKYFLANTSCQATNKDSRELLVLRYHLLVAKGAGRQVLLPWDKVRQASISSLCAISEVAEGSEFIVLTWKWHLCSYLTLNKRARLYFCFRKCQTIQKTLVMYYLFISLLFSQWDLQFCFKQYFSASQYTDAFSYYKMKLKCGFHPFLLLQRYIPWSYTLPQHQLYLSVVPHEFQKLSELAQSFLEATQLCSETEGGC